MVDIKNETSCDYEISWTLIQTQNQITSRSSHGVSVIDNNIIVFGGENLARTPINSKIQVLEGSDWKEVKVSNEIEPSHRIAHSQAVVGKNLYVFGGR